MLIGYEKPVFALLSQIKMIEHTPQTTDLDSRIAVDLRIKTIIAAKAINRNGISGQGLAVVRQFVIHQKAEKLAHRRRARKFRTAEQPVTLQTIL